MKPMNIKSLKTDAVLSGTPDEQALTLARKLHFNVLDLRAGRMGARWDSGGRKVRDDRHHIHLLFSGALQVAHNQQVLDLQPGQAYFLPGHILLERRCRRQAQVLTVQFRCEWLPGVDPLLDWPERQPAPLGPIDEAIWRPWLRRGWKPNANHYLELQGHLQCWMAALLPDLSRLIGRHVAVRTQFEPVLAKIEADLGADLRMADLAKLHSMKLTNFSAAFSAATGLSPKEYVNRRLNQEARELILNTDLKIKAISRKLRFSSPFYFSRYFSKRNGTSPAHYRERFRVRA